MSDERPKYSAGKFGKYACTRCGWKWTPRPNSPDPPQACARCRSAYWQSAPVSSRANSPNDPKWQAERDSVARRKRERHVARLRELAAEFGIKLPLINDRGAILPAKDPRQPAPIRVEPWVRFNDPPPGPPSTPAPPPPSEQRPFRKSWRDS